MNETAADFETALNENPDDFGLMAIYADWLEENGDDLAVAYRWCAEYRRRPYFWSPWWILCRSVNCDVCRVPHLVWRKLNTEESNPVEKRFPTRHAAMKALADALRTGEPG